MEIRVWNMVNGYALTIGIIARAIFITIATAEFIFPIQ